jgi:hypothetical protein
VAGYRLATAEDVPARDPLSWIVSGSTDCSIFTALDMQTDYPTTTARNVYLPVFSLPPRPQTYAGQCFKFRATRMRFYGSAIQLSEFQLLDSAGNRITGATASLAAGTLAGLITARILCLMEGLHLETSQ